MSLSAPLRLVLIATAMMIADCASAAQLAANDTCSRYGFAPATHDDAACRMNVRHYWTTGPCGDNRFARTHRRYCHLNPPLDF